MSNRRSVLTTTTLIAIGLWLLPTAAGGKTSARHRISETRRVIEIGTQGKPGTASFRLIGVGTLDGTIGAAQIHGALRTRIQTLGPGRAIVEGTEFDTDGSRSFVINLHYTITNGQAFETGTGRWTGGTGAYSRARRVQAQRWRADGRHARRRPQRRPAHLHHEWLLGENPLRKESEC